ncbi:MAG: sugar phosphate isomerase/epimerase [Gemmatimonadetes bacterium]|nr:sugar phosphate isomerase/epimerase [Gemmatimonadota bacterium]
MHPPVDRRSFLTAGALAAVAATLPDRITATLPSPSGEAWNAGQEPLFRISLAQWSLHRALQSGALSHLDFARVTRELGLDAVEYVNSFFKDKARDAAWLREMNQRAADHGIYQHLIMCDGEGRLGDPDAAARSRAVENHHRWVDTARTLGCRSIRVNAASEGSWDEQARLAADGLRSLCEYGETADIHVIVENHGGLSSNGKWLAGVMRLVDHPRCGTLPDFGNFNLGNGEVYDKYLGVAELMPFAKAVSAKSHDFDEHGDETEKDYRRLMKIVLDAGYRSWVGIEYEGSRLPELEGIGATHRLLLRVREEMAGGRSEAW